MGLWQAMMRIHILEQKKTELRSHENQHTRQFFRSCVFTFIDLLLCTCHSPPKLPSELLPKRFHSTRNHTYFVICYVQRKSVENFVKHHSEEQCEQGRIHVGNLYFDASTPNPRRQVPHYAEIRMNQDLPIMYGVQSVMLCLFSWFACCFVSVLFVHHRLHLCSYFLQSMPRPMHSSASQA